jgi:hypothetical protein
MQILGYCKPAMIAGIILVAFVFAPTVASAQSTGGAEAPSQPNANVYVRYVLGPNGPIYVASFQYAGNGQWDDCDNCADSLQLIARKGKLVYLGPAAEGKKGAYYRLRLKHRQTFIHGAYRYSKLADPSDTKSNNHWRGRRHLLEKKNGRYLSSVAYRYFDPHVMIAPDGLCDPTKRTCNK